MPGSDVKERLTEDARPLSVSYTSIRQNQRRHSVQGRFFLTATPAIADHVTVAHLVAVMLAHHIAVVHLAAVAAALDPVGHFFWQAPKDQEDAPGDAADPPSNGSHRIREGSTPLALESASGVAIIGKDGTGP